MGGLTPDPLAAGLGDVGRPPSTPDGGALPAPVGGGRSPLAGAPPAGGGLPAGRAPSYRMDRATPADDAALRALLRQIPVPGAVVSTSEREPSFFAADAVLGEDVVTLVARERPGGPPVGFGSRAVRTVWLGGRPVRTAYLSGLRVAPGHRGRALLGRGWTALRALHDADPVALSLLSVTAENRRAARLLALGRGDAARLAPVADVVTLALVVHRGHRPPPAAPPGAADAFRQSLGPTRDLFPAGPLRLPGLSPADDVVVTRDGEPVAALALWDAGAVRQSVVRSYGGALGRLRPVVNAAARLAGAAPLPDVGEPVRSAVAVRPVSRDARALDALLAAALGRARQRGRAFVLVGLDARDPALALARRRPHVAYRSTLYAACWPGEAAPAVRRPVHPEIATF